MSFVDEKNSGVSHFGLHPDDIPRDSVWFDVFHLRCAITRRLMATLRRFLMKQTIILIQEFSETILSSFWTDYNVLVWNLNKPFASFIGSKLLIFIENTKKIVGFLQDRFVNTSILKALCDALLIWETITPFLVISTIDDEQKYKREMSEFLNNVKSFYAAGSKTFLTQKSIGDDETFYLHALRFYLLKIAEETFRDHNLGLGVFTMQGFERRNKESKNTLKRFTNNRGNIVVSNLKRLYDVYDFEQNKV